MVHAVQRGRRTAPTRIRYLSWVCQKGWATGREGEKESWMEKGVGVVLGGSGAQPAPSVGPCVQRMTLDTGLQEMRFNGFVCLF